MEIADVQRKLDVAGDDLALINMRLDESKVCIRGNPHTFLWYKHDAEI